ncbi:MAG: isoprenylcysteine carboxylmethyltransferase family protein [Anaerolineae bacterium]|nr:isoprenylcysteine carboxylmethyltransferase family protein [Anaerolineae bacterium]
MSRSMILFLVIGVPILALLLACLGAATFIENLTGLLLFVIGIAFLAGPPIYYMGTKQPYWLSGRGRISQEEKGDLSFWLILPGFLLVFFGSPLEFSFLPVSIPRGVVLEGLGLLLFGLGLGLFIWARRTLRDQYSGHIQINVDHILVITGPYHYVRHPAYSGYLLMTLGIVIGYSSLVGVASVLLLLLPGILYRVRLEEQILSNRFPMEYKQYARKTGCLIPKKK